MIYIGLEFSDREPLTDGCYDGLYLTILELIAIKIK